MSKFPCILSRVQLRYMLYTVKAVYTGIQSNLYIKVYSQKVWLYTFIYRFDCVLLYTGLTVYLYIQVWLCIFIYRFDCIPLYTGLTVYLYIQVWLYLYIQVWLYTFICRFDCIPLYTGLTVYLYIQLWLYITYIGAELGLE
jgi:hypothetical protein